MPGEPIEISASDLIDRPLDVVTVQGAATKSPGLMDQVKGVLQMIKQFKDMQKDLKEMGIDLGSMIGAGVKVQDQPQQPQQPPAAPMDQLRILTKVLMLKYGDLSVNELIEKLKKDYGNKKLSSF